MAVKALTAAQIAELNWRGPFTGIGAYLAALGAAGNPDYQLWDNPALADTDGILPAVTDDGTEQTITTGFTNPTFPRNVTATAGGTAGDIKAITVTVNGTDYDGNVISEVLPAFTVNTAGTVTGSKAFKTITSVVIPAHDGTGATTAIGFGDKLGLKKTLAGDTHLFALADGVRETTAPTIAFSASALESNTVDFNTALNGARDFVLAWLDMRESDLNP